MTASEIKCRSKMKYNINTASLINYITQLSTKQGPLLLIDGLIGELTLPSYGDHQVMLSYSLLFSHGLFHFLCCIILRSQLIQHAF